MILKKKFYLKEETKPEDVSHQVLQKIWSSVRLNNGIKILLSALNTKVPITEADAIRALACKVCAIVYKYCS